MQARDEHREQAVHEGLHGLLEPGGWELEVGSWAGEGVVGAGEWLVQGSGWCGGTRSCMDYDGRGKDGVPV